MPFLGRLGPTQRYIGLEMKDRCDREFPHYWVIFREHPYIVKYSFHSSLASDRTEISAYDREPLCL